MMYFRFIPVLLLSLHIIPGEGSGAIAPYTGIYQDADIHAQDVNGHIYNLTADRNKVILVNFWASWCVPCVTEMPSMNELVNRLREQSFEVLAINVSEPANRVKTFLSHMDIDFTVLLDKNAQISKDWKVKVLPTSFILDTDRKIRYKAVGAIRWDSDESLDIIRNLIDEQK